MNRAQHSLSAYRRLMQISRAALFIFVEGYTDRYVYSQIADCECQASGVDFQMVAAEELPGGAGGKPALLNFFDYLRRKSSLIDSFKGKTTVSIFFLDKDIDDFLRTKRRSEHIVYTETYELENYLFMHGELSEAAAASTSLEARRIRAALDGYTSWRQTAAAKWAEWVKLCLFSHTRKIGSACNYGRPRSPINRLAYEPVEADKYECYLSALRSQCNLAAGQFERCFARLCRKVDRLYSTGQHDLIFKGRWYVCFLVEDIQKIAGGRRYQSRYLDQRLLSSLAQTLNFDDAWAEYFRAPIRVLLTKAGI